MLQTEATTIVWDWMGSHRGDYLMALDQVLCESWTGPLLVRFFGWTVPTVSLGVHQHLDQVVRPEVCRRLGVDVVRRPTGGGAVLHHLEITYSVVGRPQQLGARTTREVYDQLAAALLEGLRLLGVDRAVCVRPQRRAGRVTGFCFAQTAHYEIAVDGKKLVGSAQRWHAPRFLQHGSLLLDFASDYAEVFRPGLFHREAFVTLREVLGRPVAPLEVVHHLARGFARALGKDLHRQVVPESYHFEALQRRNPFSLLRAHEFVAK